MKLEQADTIRAELAALDLSAENARIAEIDAERQNIADAIERADKRREEITRDLEAARNTDRGEAVADALLTDLSPTEAARLASTNDKLFQERADLAKGTNELRRRDDDLVQERCRVQDQAAAIAGTVVIPVLEGIDATARAAGQSLLECYAAAAAISQATNSRRGETDRMGQAIAGLMSGGAVLRRLNVVEVPAAVAAMLAPLRDKGPALRSGSPQTIGIPGDHNFIAAMAAAGSILAEAKR